MAGSPDDRLSRLGRAHIRPLEQNLDSDRFDSRTRGYVARRTKQGLGKKKIIRCLKRRVTREVHAALLADFKIFNSA